jgi:hypothetical protein
VQLLESFDAIGIQFEAGLTQEHVGEQAAAHADLAVHAPHSQLDPFRLQRLVPRQNMLVHAVNERAVEIEEKCRLLARRLGVVGHVKER